MSIRFDGRVAIVTGAGGGLGRAHALELARRGAKVVVNDLGGDRTGAGGSLSAAQKVVEEIKAFGGEAVADGHSVSDPAAAEAIVKTALDAFGRIDIVVNNAGILRDKSFSKMTIDDIQAVTNVHLLGAFYVTKAAWPHLVAQTYGRIIVTASTTGLYGNFGQANYGAAKLGLVGLANNLKIEGQKYNIRINTIVPVAATRMTEDIMPPAVLEKLKPELVTPAVVFLCSEDAPTGEIIEAGAGHFARARIYKSTGLKLGDAVTADDVASNWEKIADMKDSKEFFNGSEAFAGIL
ncbi:SDR family oxidoreductase [Zavarzinia sp. CC-PAN008]|uniref:SDR family oxidoreductase n=1 Tax=Zavarzinia sp. CC-PAN008 TaxID=3243332 RepID=UPI003F744F0E